MGTQGIHTAVGITQEIYARNRGVLNDDVCQVFRTKASRHRLLSWYAEPYAEPARILQKQDSAHDLLDQRWRQGTRLCAAKSERQNGQAQQVSGDIRQARGSILLSRG